VRMTQGLCLAGLNKGGELPAGAAVRRDAVVNEAGLCAGVGRCLDEIG
jgi:hypothetical protein